MNLIQQTLRAVLFLILAFFGLVMAFIFMASTALAIGVLYIVARLQGRPFGVKAYWAERRRPSMAPRGGAWSRTAGQPARERDVTDIEMREIP
ncbi:putative exported protein [Castellaniella defragrans 65Phen]|uniref:Putative exported protein n=1 Tax=Castellaniella defragrans (strain DSM 12143 / CCUG 39792 / 65Phen) TaxID=1437824 RepID=W8X0Q4_CASD6|nr:hypothetical protein [Castellaniella defragrans]CDM25494.1 putative exported protein [Castellaniella defragrans 65Phen]